MKRRTLRNRQAILRFLTLVLLAFASSQWVSCTQAGNTDAGQHGHGQQPPADRVELVTESEPPYALEALLVPRWWAAPYWKEGTVEANSYWVVDSTTEGVLRYELIAEVRRLRGPLDRNGPADAPGGCTALLYPAVEDTALLRERRGNAAALRVTWSDGARGARPQWKPDRTSANAASIRPIPVRVSELPWLLRSCDLREGTGLSILLVRDGLRTTTSDPGDGSLVPVQPAQLEVQGVDTLVWPDERRACRRVLLQTSDGNRDLFWFDRQFPHTLMRYVGSEGMRLLHKSKL